jgi:DNA mismatch repair protein MutS
MKSPLMTQYLEAKGSHPDELLLFQVGDFFETFYDDAERLSRTLGITLTSREMDRETGRAVPLAGFPVAALDSYLPRLVRAGLRVAVCEQAGDPAGARRLVRREITEIVTPGTLVSGQALGASETALLASLHTAGERTAAAFCELASGLVEAVAGTGEPASEICRRQVRELLVPEGADLPWFQGPLTRIESWRFEPQAAKAAVERRLGVATLEGLGLEGDEAVLGAVGALLSYVEDVKRSLGSRLTWNGLYETSSILLIDRRSALALDLVETAGQDPEAVLAAAVDRTVTAGGARLLRSRLLAPPADPRETAARLDAVSELIETGLHAELASVLGRCCDLERQAGRLLTLKSTPRDLHALAGTAALLPGLADLLAGSGSGPLAGAAAMDTLSDLAGRISSTLSGNPPNRPGEGDTIAPGVSRELDELRVARSGGRSWMTGMEERERAETGVQKLSIGYNRVFGYYVEVPRSAADRMPERFQRRQTLAGVERYSTPELREMESRILRAEEGIAALERELFEQLRAEVAAHAPRIRAAGAMLSALDVACSSARLAVDRSHTRPRLAEGPCLVVEEGRHPVLDVLLPQGECVPNSVRLDADRRIIVVTGPNMAGKSTYLRQAALLAVMAQAGMFVPAASMTMSPLDRIFTRIGSADRIARGQSTFLVEMADAAAVLNLSTPRSLAIIDEVGRGTSTFDGLSLAWAMVEHLHGHPVHRPLVLFATHYHELTRLAAELPLAANASAPVRETRGGIVFLYRMADGPADRSYGLHVASMAGVPPSVVARAARVLSRLEREGAPAGSGTEQMSLPLDAPPDGLVEMLRALEPDSMSPLEGLRALYELKSLLGLQGPSGPQG